MIKLPPLVLAALLLPLSACGRQDEPVATTPKQEEGFIAGKVREGIAEAKKKLETENLGINDVHVNVGGGGKSITHDTSGLPKAEITPQGELLIEGKAIATNAAQQARLLAYRKELIGVAEAGMDIGANAAELGVGAAKEAIWGMLTGKDEKEIEAKVEARTGPIKEAAKAICNRLPGLLAAQQQLAAEVPEFKPYAHMTQEDIDDCYSDDDGGGVAVMSDQDRADLQQDIREAVREGVREGIQEGTKATTGKVEAPAPARQ